MIFLKMNDVLCNSHWNTRSNNLAWGRAKLIFCLEAEILSVLCSVQLQMNDPEIHLRRVEGHSRQRVSRRCVNKQNQQKQEGATRSVVATLLLETPPQCCHKTTISSSCLLGLRGAETLIIFCGAFHVALVSVLCLVVCETRAKYAFLRYGQYCVTACVSAHWQMPKMCSDCLNNLYALFLVIDLPSSRLKWGLS